MSQPESVPRVTDKSSDKSLAPKPRNRRRRKAKARAKTSAKSSALVPQPHGGALSPGNPGNVGGSGRPPSEVRAAAALAFDAAIPELTRLATQAGEDGDRIRAIDVLGKYGLGPAQAVMADDVRARVADTWALFRALIPEADSQSYIDRYRAIWSR